MAKGQIHLGPSGPAPCSAEPGGRGCPYEADGHYGTQQEAESVFAAKMGGSLPEAVSRIELPETIELSSNIGSFEVVDGDLSDARARVALSSGLCGDLALAIHRQTGGAPYFLSYSFDSDEALAAAFAEEPNAVIAGSTHVVLESPTLPGHFIDSYGQQYLESLEDSYDDAAVLRGTPEMLEHFADSASADRLEKFAQSAIALDAKGERYASDLDELDWEEDESDEDDWEDFDASQTVELQLDFGSIEVVAGDLSDPKTRFYFANGLCGDLAMAVQEKQGGKPFFAVDSSLSTEELDAAAKAGTLGDQVSHAFIESKHWPGFFIDGYGLKSRSEIEEFYGTEIREVGLEHLRAFGSGPGGQRGPHDLSAFAETVASFDRDGINYSYRDYGIE